MFLNIDNNPSERALRDLVVGRKNWMFAGSDKGGATAAVMCTFVSTCKRHSVDPAKYFLDVFTRLPATPHTKIEDFLPDRWNHAKK
jgi:transposase